MLRDLTPAQLELAEYMSDLSEEAYCAGWMRDLEYALWDAAYGGDAITVACTSPRNIGPDSDTSP
jgi:hypothetical protein